MFAAQFSNSAGTSAVFAGLNGSANNALLGAVATIVSGACTFDALYVAGTITANAASDTLTVTLVKNGSATALSTSITVSTLNTTVSSSDTTIGHSFAVVAGDSIAIEVTQTSGTPTVRLSITSHCQ